MPDNDRQQARNRLVVCVFAALCTGFILAMALGAFFANATTEMKEIPAWTSLLITGISALVSAYAVYLVAETLRATRDTLDATRIMAADQRQMAKEQARIGNAQIRPWLLVDRFFIEYEDDINQFNVTIKNFGNTPATDVRISLEFCVYEYIDRKDDESGVLLISSKTIGGQYVNALAPSATLTAEKTISDSWFDLEGDYIYRIELGWQYRNYDRTIRERQEMIFSIAYNERTPIISAHV